MGVWSLCCNLFLFSFSHAAPYIIAKPTSFCGPEGVGFCSGWSPRWSVQPTAAVGAFLRLSSYDCGSGETDGCASWSLVSGGQVRDHVCCNMAAPSQGRMSLRGEMQCVSGATAQNVRHSSHGSGSAPSTLRAAAGRLCPVVGLVPGDPKHRHQSPNWQQG